MELRDFAISADHLVVDTVSGPMVCFRHDTGVSDTLARFGEYGAGELFVYRRLLSPGDTFIDVGANIGAISAALQRDRRGYRILGFEPQLPYHALAGVNLMHGDDAQVFPLAVGDRDGVIDVPMPDIRQSGNFGAVSLDLYSGLTCPAPIVRLDSFLKLRAPRPRVVKIDVEGMEEAVLDGLSGLIHPGLVLCIEADRPPAVRRWFPRLVAAGMECYLLFTVHVSPGNPRHVAGDPKCGVRSVQVVAFAGEPGPAFLADFQGMRLRTLEEYEARMRRGRRQPASVSTDSP